MVNDEDKYSRLTGKEKYMEKIMRKTISLLLAVLMIALLTACGKKDNFCGTWKVDYIEYDGSKFTVEEGNNIEDEDLSDFYIILKDGGKAYVYDDEYGTLVNWLKSDDSIMIGDEKCSIVDGEICLEYYGDKIYLKKASDNQDIPDENDEENEEDEEENNENLSFEEDSTTNETTSIETENNSLSDDSEWKQFLKDYEAWVDDYIEIINKYKNNPSDMSLLSDYTKMVSKMADWSQRADEIELEIKDTSAAMEYSAELLRIAGKLAEAAY